jgi:hypothetical protein
MPANGVRVEGIPELRRALRRAEDGLQKELGKAHKRSADVVAAAARARTPVRSGALRASIKAGGSQRFGTVKGGSSKVKYFGFIDFGGTIAIPSRMTVIQRTFISEGRILYPALASKRSEMERYYEREIEALIRRAGLDGTTTVS